MAIWNILGIAPTVDEDDIGYAYTCAICRAIDGKDRDALQSLKDAYAKALQAVHKGMPTAEEPLTKPLKNENIARLTPLFQRSQSLADSCADENAWLEFTASPAFLELQDDPYLIDWLVWLCAKPYPDMASALYTAYGFASSRALSVHPTSGRLRQQLMDYCQLQTSEIPFLFQQDILRLTTSTLNGILSLQKEPQSVHLWQQVFQVSDFLLMSHQPHFLLALGRFVNKHNLSGECLLTLAEACSEQIRRCPCAAELASRLPRYNTSQTWPPPELFAGFLLQGNAKEYFDGARDKIFFLLDRTSENFRHSRQRHPWDYVFARPQFSLVKHDSVFLEKLIVFLENRSLPLVFWQSLHDAYLEDFLKLKTSDDDSPLCRLRGLVRTQLMEKQAQQDKTPASLFRSTSLLGAATVVYLIAALWICFQAPWVGVPLLLLPLLLFFL